MNYRYFYIDISEQLEKHYDDILSANGYFRDFELNGNLSGTYFLPRGYDFEGWYGFDIKDEKTFELMATAEVKAFEDYKFIHVYDKYGKVMLSKKVN